MTDPTPTRDEGLLRALIEELRPYAAKPLGSIRIDTDDIRKIIDWFDASAPAPASVGVDAGRVTLFSALEAAYIRGAAWCAEMGMTHTFSELRKAAYDYADKEEKDVICREVRASLSPAATPVSEGEPVAAVVAEELALKIVSLSVNWLREDGTDREHDDYVRANWTKEIAEAKRLILAALAKPASSPAGVVRDAAIEMLSHLKLYVLEKLEPADADMLHDRMHDLTAALSQSTSAGRVGE